MGPTTKLPSLGHIGFEAMVASYEEQAAALIEGGVDVLLIETAQDLLQAKIATISVLEAMRKAGKRSPVTVQVTRQESGTMLLGTEIGAALTALEPFDVDAIGLNCAAGLKEICSIRSIVARDIPLATRPAPIWRTRRSCSLHSSRKKMSASD